MKKILSFCVVLIGLGVLALSAQAAPGTRPETQAALHASRTMLAGQDQVQLALELRPKKGWHLYWKNYGDTGSETTVTFAGWPKNTLVGAWQYPTPQRLLFGELMNYGYKKPVTLLTKVSLPENVPSAAFQVIAKAQWLACTEEICVPENKQFTLSFNQAGNQAGTSDKTPARIPAQILAQIFAEAEKNLPAKVSWKADYHLASGQLQLKVVTGTPLGDLTAVEFFPATAPVIKHAAPQLVLKKSDALWLETEADTKKPPEKLDGVLVLVDKSGARRGYDLTFAPSALALVPPADADVVGTAARAATAAGVKSEAASGPNTLGAVPAFSFALLGGLLLNLMPCVFPILALKAFSLSRAGQSEAHARRDGLAYTAGVVLTFALIGATLLALRASGEAVGWGFQLQKPWLVALLGLLMVAIALNLAGLFEIGGRLGSIGGDLTQKTGAAGAFWTGALAVIVATPCTAPFMAGALGAALVLPPLGGMAVFLGLGLGMALPFLALGYVPGLRRLLPRPGAWMEGFKQFLAFPMLATALWLFWVLGQLTSATGMATGLAAGLLLALGLWLWGRRSRWGQGLGLVAMLVGLASPLLLARAQALPETAANVTAQRTAEPYSDARLAELLKQGRPVFAYFTADWCISCKVNERVAINRADVSEAFARAGVTTLVGDWTKRDDRLGKVLERHGRAGVPLYLYWRKGVTPDQPIVLPQVLTPDLLKDMVRS